MHYFSPDSYPPIAEKHNFFSAETRATRYRDEPVTLPVSPDPTPLGETLSLDV